MKAYYKTILRGDSANSALKEKADDVYEYVLLEITEPCCQQMKEALEHDAIKFGEFGESYLNQDCNINFGDCSPYAEGAVWDEYPIHFCPFCGQKVETEERERVILRKTKRVIPSRVEDDYSEKPM